MATETEIVKARFGADTNVSAAASMTADARARSASIGEVVMTLNAVHLAMFFVGKAQEQRLTTPHERFTEAESRATPHQCKQCNERAEDDCQHGPRMQTEYEPGGGDRGLLSRRSRRARAQQREQRDT